MMIPWTYVLCNMMPIPLIPNVHLLGGVLRNIRHEYRGLVLASLGVFTSVHPLVHIFFTYILIMAHQTKKYLTSFVPLLMPDPLLDIPQDNNTATLHLYMQADTSNWCFTIDYQDKSILARISAVGGFWTVANGIFATIFSMTLWWILFGK